MNYFDALNYIHSVSWKGSRPGLERITKLCSMLGNPQKNMKYIHVTGTNGKGSTCAMTDCILREAGYKVGLFTSPYIRKFTERMAVNGEPIQENKLAEITEYVKQFADKMEDKPTEFELITAIGFEYFKREKCEIVILEVGMGGRLDSTNIIENPVLSVITGVSLDHTAFLGDTVAKIAHEKAGIIKKSSDVLYCGKDIENENPETAYFTVKNKAEEENSKLYLCDYTKLKVRKMTVDGTVFDYKEGKNYEIGLLGSYQPENAVKAIEIAEILKNKGFKISDDNIRDGLKETTWRARFEKFYRNPAVIYDGGHNPEGIEAAINSIKIYFKDKKINLVTGVMADKDYPEMAKNLSPYVDKVFTLKPDNVRALDAEKLAEVYRELGHSAKACKNAEEAFFTAVNESKKTNTPLICLGSLYMYPEIADAKDKYDETK